ncbi:MAG: ATP phosphoribosyltransferase regulatory subunit [Clostridia bacterium]|nr:ATP phosphoribosyltransferase regulatory subunit [Clostridia bacterium]
MGTEMKKGLFERGEAMEHSLRELYISCGYRPYKMSKFEPYDLYLQNRSFVTGGSILTFTDTDGRLMALKPDVTLSVIKNYRGGQQKICYHENVYRDTGASHEFREIPQAGLECIGEIDLYTQLEVLTLAAQSLRRISDQAILDIASVDFLTGLLADTGVDAAAQSELLACLHEKNAHSLCMICERKNVPKAASAVWQEIASMYGPAEELLPRLKDLCLNEAMRQAAQELSDLCGLLQALDGVAINLDFSILQDLSYYTGLVFRGYVPGLHTGILSGGRYDHLVKKLGKNAGAIGFAVYLDLLSQLPAGERGLDADVLLLYGDRDAPADVLEKAKAIRATGKTVRVQRREEPGRYGQVIRMGGD